MATTTNTDLGLAAGSSLPPEAAALLGEVRESIRTERLSAAQLNAVLRLGLAEPAVGAEASYRDTAYQDRYQDTAYRDSSSYADTPSYRDAAR